MLPGQRRKNAFGRDGGWRFAYPPYDSGLGSQYVHGKDVDGRATGDLVGQLQRILYAELAG